MTTTDPLIAFLKARLDDDEQVARVAGGVHWKRGAPNMAAEWDSGEEPWRDDYLGISVAEPPSETVVTDDGAADGRQLDHIARHDPARVLDEVEAKRRVVDHVEHELADHGADNPYWYDDRWKPVLRLLTLPYADHDEWREEWRP